MLSTTNTLRSSCSTLMTSTQPSHETLISKEFNTEYIKPGNLKVTPFSPKHLKRTLSPTKIVIKKRFNKNQASDISRLSGGVSISARMLLSKGDGSSNKDLPKVEEGKMNNVNIQDKPKSILKKRRSFAFSSSKEVNMRLSLNDPRSISQEKKMVRFADTSHVPEEEPRKLAQIYHVESYKNHNFSTAIHENIHGDNLKERKAVCNCSCGIY